MKQSLSYRQPAEGDPVAGQEAESIAGREAESVAGRGTESVAGTGAEPFLSLEAIDIPVLLERARHPGAGAMVLFRGDVRDSNRGKEVDYLVYEAHESIAGAMIGAIVREAVEKWDLKTVAAVHRLGRVGVGDTAVAVITTSAHRGEAYAANRFIIERIKHEVPVWKCEYYTDGTHAWGNNCRCAERTGDPAKHIYEEIESGAL